MPASWSEMQPDCVRLEGPTPLGGQCSAPIDSVDGKLDWVHEHFHGGRQKRSPAEAGLKRHDRERTTLPSVLRPASALNKGPPKL